MRWDAESNSAKIEDLGSTHGTYMYGPPPARVSTCVVSKLGPPFLWYKSPPRCFQAPVLGHHALHFVQSYTPVGFTDKLHASLQPPPSPETMRCPCRVMGGGKRTRLAPRESFTLALNQVNCSPGRTSLDLYHAFFFSPFFLFPFILQ